MQITFDTATASGAELSALARFVHDLAALQTAPEAVTTPAAQSALDRVTRAIAHPTPAAPIAPADQPDAGSPPPDVLDAAAVFGQQRAAPASVPGIPTVPVAPAGAASPASATVPPSTAAGPSTGVELDKTGLPWDPRIHTGTKAKNADGTWRQRRSLNDDALLKRVEAELRATMALPAAPVPPAPPVPPAAPVVPPTAAATEQYLAGPPTPPAPATFGEFITQASNLVAGGKLTSEALTLKLQGLGLPSVMALANRPDMIAPAWQALHS